MMQIQDGNQPPRRAMTALRDDQTPGWAPGLRQLYNAVAAEPIPSDFSVLLARLDARPARGSSH